MDKSTELAGTAKTELDTSTQKAGEAKTALDGSAKTAGEMQETLNATVKQAGALDTSLGEKIKTGTQLKTDLVASGEKALQDIQTAGSEQLDKMQAVAEEFTADREQITTNKEDIGSLKEDLGNKITKFYASNQGENHLADSDDGKIQDMMIHGKSSQDGTPSVENPVEIKSVVNPTIKLTGSNILKMIDGEYQKNGVTITVSNGVIKIKGTSNGKFDFKLTENIDTFFKEGTEIIFSSNNVKGTEGKDNVYLDFSNNTTIGFSIMSANLNTPYIIKERDTKYSFNLWIRCSGAATIDETWKPQILIGKTITTFKPYTEQTITLPITLNAIPVSSGGNVTIDGQQYIADRVVEKDGVFGAERNIREIHTNTKTMNNSEEYPGWNKVEGISDVIYYNEQPVGTSRALTFISNFTQSALCQNNIKPNNIMFLRWDIIGYSQSELIAKAIDVDMYVRLQDAIFEPLPGDMQAKLRTLVTNYPVTNISVTSDQLDGYTVFNYPISMANGWNYVKQQLGDTRDYIYDMDAKAQDIDIQSAEAYVNSEYAVALTELEV